MSSLFPQIEGVIAKISKSNALYPLLVALVLCFGIVVVVFIMSENTWLRLFSLLIPGIIIFRIDRSYEYFSRNNPDMLRSETHVLQKQALALIGDESRSFDRTVAIVAVLNPSKPIKKEDKIELPVATDNQTSPSGNEPLELQ